MAMFIRSASHYQRLLAIESTFSDTPMDHVDIRGPSTDQRESQHSHNGWPTCPAHDSKVFFQVCWCRHGQNSHRCSKQNWDDTMCHLCATLQKDIFEKKNIVLLLTPGENHSFRCCHSWNGGCKVGGFSPDMWSMSCPSMRDTELRSI